jgi:hypothetical protein
METGWILRRGLATGAINYMIDRKRYSNDFGRALIVMKNLITLPLSVLRAVSLIKETRHWLPASHPICVSIGRNLAAFGFSPAPYKSPSTLSAPTRAINKR